MSQVVPDAEWWQIGKTSDFLTSIEKEIYLAVKEFVTSEDPDITLRYLMLSAQEGVCLHTYIEGRGIFPYIEHSESIRTQVESEIDNRANPINGSIDDGEDRDFLEALEGEFRSMANAIRTRLDKEIGG